MTPSSFTQLSLHFSSASKVDHPSQLLKAASTTQVGPLDTPGFRWSAPNWPRGKLRTAYIYPRRWMPSIR